MGVRLIHLLLLLVAALVVPRPAVAAEVPPAPTDYVTDRAGVLSEAARRELAARLRVYEERSGHQVLVWVGRTSGELSVEEFAVRAFEAWKVGRARLDDGVVLFVLVDDRKVRIEVGYGLEDRVTDLQAGRIIREVVVPAIVAGDFDAAARSGAEAIADTIEGRRGALPGGGPGIRGPPEQARGPSMIVMIVLGAAFLLLLITHPRLALFFLWSMTAGRGGGGFGGGGFGGGGGRSGGGGATGGW